jgi:hypothetical protein
VVSRFTQLYLACSPIRPIITWYRPMAERDLRVPTVLRKPPVQSTESLHRYSPSIAIGIRLCQLTSPMISWSSLGRRAQLVVQKQCCASPSNRRGLAAAASGTFQYQTGDAAGVKFATRDLAGPTTTLAVVAKAGTRYQILPGFTEGLEKFAFKVR